MTFPYYPLEPRVDLLMPPDLATDLAPDWLDVTADVATERSTISIRRGRRDWSSQVDAGSCSLELTNADGTYSPRNPLSTLFGKIGRNGRIRVGVGVPPLGRAWPKTTATTSHVAPSVVNEVDGTLFCAWLGTGVGTYTVPGSMTGQAGFSGSAAGFRTATEDVTGTPTGARTATYSLSQPYAALGVVMPGTGLSFTTDGGASTLDGEIPLAVDAVIGDYLLAIHAYAQDPDDLMTAAPADVENPTSGWILVADSGASSGPRVKAWVRRVLFEGEQNVVLRGAPNADIGSQLDSFGRLFAVTGVTDYFPRFVGEVASWPSRWNPPGTEVWVPIQAAGVLRRLGMSGRAPAHSALFRHFVSSPSLLAYWPLEDVQGVSDLGSALPDGTAMTIVGGTPDAAADSGWICSDATPTWDAAGARGDVPLVYASEALQVCCLVGMEDGPTADESTILTFDTIGGTAKSWVLKYDVATDGIRLQVFDPDAVSLLDTVEAFGDLDGRRFLLCLSMAVDGSDVDWSLSVVRLTAAGGTDTDTATGTLAAATFGSARAVTVGGALDLSGGISVGHVAVTNQPLPTLAASSAAPLTAWLAETASERVARICREEHVACWTQYDATSEPMGPQLTGRPLDLLRQCAETDGGFLQEALGFAGLAYRARGTLQNQGTGTLNRLDLDCETHVLAPLEPVEDDQLLTNDVTLSRIGGATARAWRATGALSILEPPNGVGRYPKSLSLSLASDAQILDQAGWRVHLGTWDEQRYPVIPVDLAANTDLIATATAIDLGDVITLASLPSWVGPSTADVLVQGCQETIGAFTWDQVWNAVPGGPYRVAQDGIEGGFLLDDVPPPISAPPGGPFTDGPPPPPPATEIVLINAATTKTGTVTGGPPNTAAGGVTACSDGSDATYITHTTAGPGGASLSGAGFAALVDHVGRDVASFVVKIRAYGANGDIGAQTFAGITTATGGAQMSITGMTPTTYDVGPFTKSGGGNWSVSDIDGMTCTISYGRLFAGGPYNITEMSVEVTYA